MNPQQATSKPERKCNECNRRVTARKHAQCRREQCPKTYIALIAVPWRNDEVSDSAPLSGAFDPKPLKDNA